MSSEKNPLEGELPEANQLYNDPGISEADLISQTHEVPSQIISSNSKRHTPLYRRRGFRNVVALGMSTLALGAALFLGGCGKSKSPPQETTQQTVQEQVVEQPSQETQQPTPEDIIVMRDPNEVSPRIVREIRESLGGLAYVDSEGWIHPNEVDGTYGNYEYDFSDPNQVVLAFMEAISNNDRELYDSVWYLPYIIISMYTDILQLERSTIQINERERLALQKVGGIAGEGQPLTENEKIVLLNLVDRYTQDESELFSEGVYIIVNKYKVFEITPESDKHDYERLMETYRTIEYDQRKCQPVLGEDLCPDIEDVYFLRIEGEGEVYAMPGEKVPLGFDVILLKVGDRYAVAYYERRKGAAIRV